MNKEKTNKVLDYFEELFPDAHCELNHQNVFELLVAVMLSAQTTDKKVNQVTASLFKKYPTVESFALASLEDLQDDIKIIGLYRNKAKNLKKMAQVLLEEYNGEVPKTRKELEKSYKHIDAMMEMLKERFVVLFLEIDGIKHIISSYSLVDIFVKHKIQIVKNVIYMICVKIK